ncbi:MAG: hypothetical protein LBS24_07950 [Clostridiales Family XIII bacterium]|nr:hypothetical protein [Clostridiales Family XIII bacterium]
MFTAAVLQARGSDKKIAFVDGASEKRVPVFEERPICLDALVYALTSLGVYPVCAQSPAEFNLALAGGDARRAHFPAPDDRFSDDETRAPACLSVAQLSSLKSALRDMDIAVVNELMMECTGILLDPKARRELSEIERLILLFEYDAAIKRIDLLIGAASVKQRYNRAGPQRWGSERARRETAENKPKKQKGKREGERNMDGYLQKAEELQNDAIRCNNRTKFIIGELTARIQRNRDLAEALKARDLAQRLSDAFNGKGRLMHDEIRQNAAQINAYLVEALREVNERSRINVEALAFVDQISADLCEMLGEYAGPECAARPPHTTKS